MAGRFDREDDVPEDCLRCLGGRAQPMGARRGCYLAVSDRTASIRPNSAEPDLFPAPTHSSTEKIRYTEDVSNQTRPV